MENSAAESAENLVDRPWLDPAKTPFIQIQGLTKKFGEFIAVDNVDLEIYQGELFSLLGGSGCGKSTLLRMMAGFEKPTSGRILIDGVDMIGVPAYQRPVNMMFQSYALFPHMTVEDNVAYGLKRDGLPGGEITERVAEMLKMVELDKFAKRKPHQLSGGQRQRVALARSLVKKPKVLLLDEPLGALDKRLREQTQYELMNLQDKLGVTFVVVTHDQEEAMTLSTRIAVMDEGYFVQIGTPTEIYEYPDSRFVADFVGSTNLFEGRIASHEGNLVTVDINGFSSQLITEHGGKTTIGARVWVAVRPEKISLSRALPEEADNAIHGVVIDLGYYGNSSTYRIRLDNDEIIQVTHPNQQRPKDGRHVAEWEEQVHLSWPAASAILLSK